MFQGLYIVPGFYILLQGLYIVPGFNIVQSTRFTEYEIVQLWNSFKQDFPSGKINRNQLTQLVRKVFPRYEWRIFDLVQG